MPVVSDPHPAFGSYAQPYRLVTTQWLSANIATPGMKVLECDEDTRLYDVGHVPGAIKLDLRTELNDQVTRDYIDAHRFAELMRTKGIARDDTVVLYGDRRNAGATHALWVFTMFGHEDVRLLDGGRDAWIDEARETTFEHPYPQPETDYPAIDRDDHSARAFREDVLAHLGRPLLDVRSPVEYAGGPRAPGPAPEDTALRGGHIPTAVNIAWTDTCGGDGRFLPRDRLDAVFGDFTKTDQLIVYSSIGERSSHTWFVLRYLLGFESVRNYDGSWIEWGNSVGMPIATGTEPGSAWSAGNRQARAPAERR